MFTKTTLLLFVFGIFQAHCLPSVSKPDQDQDPIQLDQEETEQVVDDVVQKPSKRETYPLFHSASDIADKIISQLEPVKGNGVSTLGNKVTTGASVQNSFESSFANQQDKTMQSSSSSSSSTLHQNIAASSGQVTRQTAHDDALNTPYKVADVLYNHKFDAQMKNGFQGNMNHKSEIQELLKTENTVNSLNKVQQKEASLDSHRSTFSELFNTENHLNSLNQAQQNQVTLDSQKSTLELVNTENKINSQNQQNLVSAENLRSTLNALLNAQNKVNQVQEKQTNLNNQRSTLSELVNSENQLNSQNQIQQKEATLDSQKSTVSVNTESKVNSVNQVQQKQVIDNQRSTLAELVNTENKLNHISVENLRSTLNALLNAQNKVNQFQQKQTNLDSQRSTLPELVNTETQLNSQNQIQQKQATLDTKSKLNSVNQVQQKQVIDNQRSTLSELLNTENKVHSVNREQQNHVSLDSQQSSLYGSINTENKVQALNQAEQKQETIKSTLYALQNAEVKQNQDQHKVNALNQAEQKQETIKSTLYALQNAEVKPNQDQRNHVSLNDLYESLNTENKINTLNAADGVHQSSLISDLPNNILISQKDEHNKLDLDSQIQLSSQDSSTSLREVLIKIIKYLLENDLQSQNQHESDTVNSADYGNVHHPSIISDLPSGFQISQKGQQNKLDLDSQIQLSVQGSSTSLRDLLIRIIKYILQNDLQSQTQHGSNTLNSGGFQISQKEDQKKWNLDSQIQLSSQGSSTTLREILIKIIKYLLENDQSQHQQGSDTLNSANGGNVHHSTIISDLQSGIQVSQTEEQKKWNLDSQILLSSQGSSASLREILIKIIKYLLENDLQSEHQQESPVVPVPDHHRPIIENQTPGHNSNSDHHASGKYDYAYEVNDDIKGSYKKAWEKREAGKVVGGYTYDDGNIIREVLYEADKAGFKIVKDKISPSIKANSPLTGKATVASIRDGQGFQYVTKQ